MEYFRKFTRVFVVIGLIFFGLPSYAAIPSVPPEILAQLKNMSPSEQRMLAKQYGFNLDQLSGLGGAMAGSERQRASLGAPGEPLEPAGINDDLEGVLLDELLAEEEEEEDAPLQRFGSSLFDPKGSTFAPVDNIPVPEGYRLGVGDELQVMLIGKEQGDFPLLIDRDGAVTLPKLGRVVLSGLSFPEAKTLIEKRVSEQLIGSEAILSMGSLRSINVFIAGAVKKPGNYSVSALSTLSQAIFIAGGVSDTGSYRDVQLKRQGKTVQSFDIYDLLLSGDNSGDVRLRSGDVVFVPVVGPQIAVSGEVVRPALFEFKRGDTIKTALQMAGGTLARGNKKRALLNRYEPQQALPKISNINLLDATTLAMKLVDGDLLSVSAISERSSNPIAIEGATELDKVVGWSQGLTIADLFGDLEADVEPTADLSLSLIVRRVNTLNDIEVLPFSLSQAALDPTSEDNIALMPFDRIVILPLPSSDKSEFERFDSTLQSEEKVADLLSEESDRQDDGDAEEDLRRELIETIVKKLKQQVRSGERVKVVNVSGAVQLPGEYPLLGNGSIQDLVALAGGYTDDAYLKRAEVRRITTGASQQANIEFLNLDLEESSAVFKLMGRDTLRVNKIPNWSTNETVQLSGEFLFPGTYTISQGETLASLVERAGGFTEDAFLKGAQYISATAKNAQAQQFKKIAQSVARRIASRKATGEFEGLGEAADLAESIDENLLGRVVIDLEGIANGDASSNVTVESGDTIAVPKFSNTIAVVGEVYEPGTFRFKPGASLGDYINTAGGETTFALTKNIYLLKADGAVDFSRSGIFKNLSRFDDSSSDGVEPGDVIVVPTNLDYDPPLTRVSAITNVVFQSLTSIAAFLSITKQ